MADSITNVLIPTQTGATRLFLGPARDGMLGGDSYDACVLLSL